MELDPRLAASSGDRSFTPNAAVTHTRNPSPSIQRTTATGNALMPPSAAESDGAETSDVPDNGLSAGQHHDADPDGGDLKRPRACEACRGLKVRCEPDPNDEGPCKRCRKAGRNCVVTVPTRKRQKKTDSRVAELEKKIDALTASLQAKGAPLGTGVHAPSTTPGTSHQPGFEQTPSSSIATAWRDLTRNGQSMAGPHWGGIDSAQTLSSGIARDHVGQGQSPASGSSTVTSGQKRKYGGAEGGRHRFEEAIGESTYPSSFFSRLYQGDIVDRGVIDMQKAEELFARYNNHMIRHLPAVVFPPGFTVSELRKTKPTLFLSVMAAAASESPPIQKALQKELMHIFADKVMLTGEKTVELIQALHVAVIWYWPPEHFEELKFYQLVHIAAVMAIDIGLGQRVPQRRGKLLMDSWRVHPSRRPVLPDPTSIENRRVWLTCYFLCANTSMALHRPNLVRWTPFMAESVKILESSPDAAPTDAYFCHLVWTHRLAEEVGIQFSHDDQSVSININDARTQYALKGLERDLDKYSASIPPDLMLPTLKMSFHVLSLYMHEMALHSPTAEQGRPGFSTENLRDGLLSSEPLSAGHISALAASLAAIEGLLNTFLGMEVDTVRCLPVFNFVRVAYGVVMLIKLYFSASSNGSELGRVINKEDMRVSYYLDNLLDKFRATAADDRSRPASKFLVVLVMLRSWFYKQSKTDAKDAAPSQAPTPAPSNTPSQPPMRPGSVNTPLQLLSEVATGSSAGAGSGNSVTGAGDTPAHLSSFARWSGIRQPPPPFFHESASASEATPPSAPTGTPSTVAAPQSLPPSVEAGNTGVMAAMAPGLAPLVAGVNVQGVGFSSDIDNGLMAGFDLEGTGLSADTQYMYEDGVRMLLDEPWFSDMFGQLPGPGNVFNF